MFNGRWVSGESSSEHVGSVRDRLREVFEPPLLNRKIVFSRSEVLEVLLVRLLVDSLLGVDLELNIFNKLLNIKSWFRYTKMYLVIILGKWIQNLRKYSIDSHSTHFLLILASILFFNLKEPLLTALQSSFGWGVWLSQGVNSSVTGSDRDLWWPKALGGFDFWGKVWKTKI